MNERAYLFFFYLFLGFDSFLYLLIGSFIFFDIFDIF